MPQSSATSWHHRSGIVFLAIVERESDESSGDTSLATVQDADDDLLPHVAPFREADGSVLDPGFERNRVAIHVHEKRRSTRFDTHDLGCLLVNVDGSGRDERLIHTLRQARDDEQYDAEYTQLVRTRDDDWLSVHDHASALVLVHSADIGHQIRTGPEPTESRHRSRQRGRTIDAIAGPCVGPVVDGDILGEDELVETCGQHRGNAAIQVQDDQIANIENFQVGHQSSLGCEIGGVAALPRAESDDIIGQKALQIVRTVGSPDGDDASRCARTHARPRSHDPILFLRHDGNASNDMLKAVRHFLRRRISTWTLGILLSLLAAPSARAQGAEKPAPGEVIFTVFVRSVPVGVERVGVSKTETGWLVTSTGQSGPPVDLDIRSFEAEYDDEWRPSRLTIDSTRNGRVYAVQTTFAGGEATNTVQQGEDRVSNTMPVDAAAVILPDFFFGAYEALAVRLSESREGDEIPVYVAPRREITAVVRGVRSQRIQTAQTQISALVYLTTFQYDARELEAEIWVDQNLRLLRVNLPAVQLDVARQDLALVSTRLTGVRHPGDTDVRVPARGFSLAASVTTPTGRERPKEGWPAVLLVPGIGLVDRDENIAGVPIFGQLAGRLADAGYLVMRYDKRGIGQSGGRPESADIEVYADDVRTMVKYLDRRDDVDGKRLIVLGHAEGGWIALQAAAKEKKIDAVVLLAVPGSPGAELVLEQQRNQLDRMQTTDVERSQQIALQTPDRRSCARRRVVGQHPGRPPRTG